MTEKVNIMEFLNEIDNGNFYYYENLTEPQKKSISLFVVSRWLSCTKNQKQICSVNNLLNPFVFKFGTNHKNLLYKLMLIASSGTNKNYKWVSKKKKNIKYPLCTQVISTYYNLSLAKSQEHLKFLGIDSIVECANSLGYDDKEIKKLKDEFKK